MMPEDHANDASEKALTLPSCPYCKKILSAHQVIQPGHCGANPCFLAHISRGLQAQKDQRDSDYAERQESAKLGKPKALAATARHFACDADDLLLAVVPYQNNPIQALTPTYREAFEQHLEAIVAEAFARGTSAFEAADPSPNASPEPSIIDAACGACQGFCCARGGGENYAFLTVKTILGFLNHHQDMQAEEVVAHYMNALPEASVDDACAFQSSQGCTLARTSRAAICNTFYCHDLYAMHDLTRGSSDVRLAIVGINDDQPEKVVAFSETSGSRVIDPL